jgi:acyl carrier protein
MIPSFFVFLDALPLTQNRKVDRRTLPAPDRTRPDLGNPFVAPRSVLEETVANIWMGVLGLEQLGVHDDFLDLGGHSLLATQILSRVQEAYNIDLSMRSFFEAATVAGIAAIIEKTKDGDAGTVGGKIISRVSR